MTSIRQNSGKSNDPWPPRVAIYAVRGLVGAAVQSEGLKIEAICHVMDALSGYLDSEREKNANIEPLLISPISLAQDTCRSSSASPCSIPDYTAQFMEEEDRTRILGTDLNEICLPSPYDAVQNLDEMSTADPTAFDNLASQVQALSLAHTCNEGQQAFKIIESRPIDDIHPKNPTKVCTTKKSSWKRNTKSPMEDYVNGQRRLATAPMGPASSRNSSYLDINLGLFPGDKSGQLMLKMYHGLVSHFAVLHVRQALLAQEPAKFMELPGEDSNNPIFHYRMIKKMQDSRSAGTVKRLYHMYLLYTSLRNPWQTEKDDQFLHEGFQTFTPGSRKRRKGPGNPLVRDAARAFEDMLIAAEPQLRYKSQEEQDRLIADVRKLQKIGERLFLLVKEFRLGILCLLFFHQSVEEAQRIFAMTETE